MAVGGWASAVVGRGVAGGGWRRFCKRADMRRCMVGVEAVSLLLRRGMNGGRLLDGWKVGALGLSTGQATYIR